MGQKDLLIKRMKVLILALTVFLASSTGEPIPDALTDDQIRDEIEIAARDSADLDDELAAMLAKLEDEEEEDEESISTVALELERAIEATEELSKASKNRKKSKLNKKQKPRKPKQDSSFVDTLIDVLDIDFDEDFDESGKRNKEDKSEKNNKESEQDQKEREGKAAGGAGGAAGGKGYAALKQENELCESASPSNNVKVCVPDFETRPQRLHFYSQETYDQEYCYLKTLTLCDFIEQPVKRDVCTFKYLEKTHNVPATNVQVSFERHSEKMGVTNCKHVKSDYGKVVKCVKFSMFPSIISFLLLRKRF